MSLEEIEKGNGQDGAPLYMTVNGKVRQLLDSAKPCDKVKYTDMVKKNGNHLELTYSKIFYDPKYGVPNSLTDFTHEHSAYIEDLAV